MAHTLPPALGGSPLLGVLPEIRRDVLGTFERARRAAGDVVRLLVGPPRLRSTTYAFFHPDGVRHAMATEADRYRKDNVFYEEVRWALGHAYFPFGAGPRACIGQYFSMLEAAILLAVIVRDYDVTSVTDRVPLAPRITLHPTAPVPARVRPLH
jgi:cytochrome P450